MVPQGCCFSIEVFGFFFEIVEVLEEGWVAESVRS